MKKQLFSFLLLISLFVSVSAQATKQVASKLDLTQQNLRKHVTYLASDRLEGRRTGERGATFAAGYVANFFANHKLKGGFTQNVKGKTKTSFLQTFPLVSNVELGADNRLMITTPSNNVVFNPKSDWIPFASSPNVDIKYAQVIFVGYGISSGEPKYNDYENLDVRGKIVFAFDGSAEKDNPHSPFQRFNIHAKAKIAKEKGAAALIIISREQKFENDKLTSLKYDATLGETAVPVVVVSRSIGAMMFGLSNEKDLQDAENQFALRKDASGNLTNRREVKAQLKINLVKKSAEAYNAIGILEGADLVLKNEAIIIGAHYDHLGRGGQGSLVANSTEIHHGADDNASGVAALLEMAREFSTTRRNKRTMIFIAFGGEEEGLLGSNFYVNNPVFPLDKTVAMINMDMIGRLQNNKLTIGGIGTASEWKGLVEYRNFQLGASTNLAPINLPVPNIPMESQATSTTVSNISLTETPAFNLQLNEDGFGPSDHSSFYGKKIPVLFFFTGTHLDYHKPTDTADKINYAGLMQVTMFVSEIVKAIDQNPKRPTYAVAKSSGMGEGRRGFNVSLGTIPNYADSNDGLLLDGVRDNSPAAKAGLKAGDKVISLAGREIRNVSDYTFILGEMKPDVEYEIVVLRGSEKLTLKIIPAARK